MNRLRALAGRVHDLLLDFFTERTSGASAGLFRIVFGLLAVWAAIGVGLNLQRYWGGDGGFPWSAMSHSTSARWSILAIAPMDDRLLIGVFALLVLASISLTVGLFPRISTVVVWAIHVSLQNRNPYTVNGGDRLFIILSLLAVLLPLDRRWSVHAWWRAKRGVAPGPPVSRWGVALLQLQIAFVYVSTGVVKLQHHRWWGGRAMRDVLSSPVYNEWPGYLDFWPLVFALTYFTLSFEVVGFPFLVWLRRTRKIALAWGLLFHLGIEILMVIPMFSVIMVVTYVLFLTDDECERLVAACVRLVRRLPGPGPARDPQATVAPASSP